MREKGQTEAAKTLETPVFSRGIEILTEKEKLLEKEDLELMKEIIEDDDIEFDLEKINEFYNDRKLQ